MQVLKSATIKNYELRLISMVSNTNRNAMLTAFGFTLLSLGIASSILMSIPSNVFAQQDQERGLLGGLEREQRGEAIPGQQPADVGGPAPLNRTLVEGDASLSSGQPSSACMPSQMAGAVGDNQTTTGGNGTAMQGGVATTGTTNTTGTTTAGGAGNQSASSPTQLIEQACIALQAGDTQGAMMQLDIALDQLRAMGGMQGGATTQGGATSTTTGPGGIGTDDPTATDNPFSDLT